MKKIIYAQPSTSGNGFIKGDTYKLIHEQNGLYIAQTFLGERYISYPFNTQSGHLWDGTNWDEAGHFVEVINNESNQ